MEKQGRKSSIFRDPEDKTITDLINSSNQFEVNARKMEAFCTFIEEHKMVKIRSCRNINRRSCRKMQ